MFEEKTPHYLWNRIVPNLESRLLTSEGSFLYDVAGPLLYELWKVYLSLNALEPMFYIDETSGPYIDKMANAFGLTRKQGTHATASITFTGTERASVPAGAVFLTADGLAYTLDAAVTIAGGAASGSLTASKPGTIYNVGAGDIRRAQQNRPGITGFTVSAAEGGVDEETDAALVERFYSHLRHPATSGNGYHYQEWASEVPGVGYARVIGLWDGAGTVKVLLTDTDLLPVDAAVVAAAEAHIEAERPIGAEVTYAAATAHPITVSATLTLSETATTAVVKAEFAEKLAEYIKELSKAEFAIVLDAEKDDLSAATTTVVYNKIATLLMSCSGVLDFSSLKVCSGTANVTVNASSVPVPGEVTFS